MRSRGQTLVLFALTLLLLVLMVTMTISIGMKAREKMELETVADAAAYSNAVATARTFNGISLMNRALMGHLVAMAGVESLISWSSYYRASIHGMRKAYEEPRDEVYVPLLAFCACASHSSSCRNLCRCSRKAISDINETRDKLEQEDSRLDARWANLDRQAGAEARELQIGSISDEQNELYTQLEEDLLNATLAGSIAREANEGARFGEELEALSNDALKKVIRQELAGRESCEGEGAACTRRNAKRKQHFVYAAMGSRGYPFVTERGASSFVRAKLQSLLPAPDALVHYTNDGSGYFPTEGRKAHSALPIDATEAWADDHGEVGIVFNRAQGKCPNRQRGDYKPEAHVRSTHLADTGDQHQWTGGKDRVPPLRVHTMGRCTQCPGMWPSHMDYNYKNVAESSDNWGQPKSYAVIQRDYGKRPDRADPWNLMFRFRFSPEREGVLFDNRGIELSTDGTNISKATALSAGITYYKRAGAFWKEPPNFLNPFWRATLVSAHVDAQGKDDAGEVLDKAAPFAGEVHEALLKKGYMAW